MVPAILILTFAWTLKAMTDSLGADVFVATAMKSVAGGLLNFLPAIIFLVAAPWRLPQEPPGDLWYFNPHCSGCF